MQDALVVGGGPAGLAAATALARCRRSVVLYDSGAYRNLWVETSHLYLGSDGEPPEDLRARALADLSAYRTAEVCPGLVNNVSGSCDDFRVETQDGTRRVRRVVLATGVSDAFPDVDGFFEHYGTSIFDCPTCDGYETQGADVVAFGWSEHVVGFALNLLEWARSVTIVTDGRSFEGDAEARGTLAENNIEVLEDDALAFIGPRGALDGVRLRSGATLPCGYAFFTIGHNPGSDLATQLGCRFTPEGCVEVDECGETSVAGVCAVGDMTPGVQMVQVAAAKGLVAGVSCALALAGLR